MAKKHLFDKMRLYVLISGNIASKSVEETAKFVIDGGADAIQLREKTLSDIEFTSLAEKVRDLTTASGTLLIINDRVHVASAINADGLHLGQQDMSVSEARTIIGDKKIIGVSTHNSIQARQAQNDGADYIAIGPVFPTTTKVHEPAIGLKTVRKISQKTDIPSIAIGGITLDNLDEILRAGVSRIAVCSAIIGTADIFSTTKRFKEKLGIR